ncbi:hypothetical protein NQ318_007701 [Aromia moschata]|uniref:Uncharacterized protein n=1 Tax=Aromia moschata TaxID=1265417 RepID=A0AAV8XR73_9CUCU|nr:hypothetical protein NQ318_007701 [Aromia moschata]
MSFFRRKKIRPHSLSTRVTSLTTGSSTGTTLSKSPSLSTLHGFKCTYVCGKMPLMALFFVENPLYHPWHSSSICNVSPISREFFVQRKKNDSLIDEKGNALYNKKGGNLGNWFYAKVKVESQKK